jgi:hypothetical protein
LEHGSTIAKDVIYGAINLTFAVKLAERVSIEGVLIAFHAAPVESGLV